MPAQKPNDFAISLIICTRNRVDGLARALGHVSTLVCASDWELILVDNGSTDDTAKLIADYAAAAAFPVRYVHQPVKGLSNARNAGVAVAQGSIIAFTDDDCYVQPDFLQAILDAFERMPTIGYVTGRIMLHDPSDFPQTINESMIPLSFPAHSYVAPGAVKGANMAFRREVLAQAGIFDPRLGAGAVLDSGEDADMIVRVSRCGWAGAYDPAIVLAHHHGRKAGDIGSLLKMYDIGRGAFHMKLLVEDRALTAGWRGWRGLPRRTWHRPVTLWWELVGAMRYIRVLVMG